MVNLVGRFALIKSAEMARKHGATKINFSPEFLSTVIGKIAKKKSFLICQSQSMRLRRKHRNKIEGMKITCKKQIFKHSRKGY